MIETKKLNDATLRRITRSDNTIEDVHLSCGYNIVGHSFCFWLGIKPAECSYFNVAILVARGSSIDTNDIGRCQRDFIPIVCLDVRVADCGNAFRSFGFAIK